MTHEIRSYEEIMKNAELLRSDPVLRAAHFKRTKPCTNMKCKDMEKCQFAHHLDEYRLPECFYSIFCKNTNCEMYHKDRITKEEYMKKYSIVFRSKNIFENEGENENVVEKKQNEPSGAFTKLCNLMTSTSPCPRKNCFFAHSIESLRLPTCHERGCYCKKFHSYCSCCPHDCRFSKPSYCKEKAAYASKMGHRIEPFMLNDDSSNILLLLNEKLNQLQLIDDIRKEEEMGTEAFEKMKESEKDIEEINQYIEKQQKQEDEFEKHQLEFLLEQERLHNNDE